MIIAIFPNTYYPHSKVLAKEITTFLSAQGVQMVAEDEYAQELQATPISDINKDTIDFLLSMGGDGTLLRLVHKYRDLQAAILGINLGHLGFMADVTLSDLYPSLQDLLDGKYQIEDRLVLQAKTHASHECFAVNDIVIHRSNYPSLLEFKVYVDGIYLNTFEADGLIVATPNGSTAYSLAAGGPIIYPSVNAIVLTPICPHTISNRPIVLPSNKPIELEYISHFSPIEILIDGMPRLHVKTGEKILIQAAEKPFRLINLLRQDYFSTLRSKLGWSGKLRHNLTD